LKHQCIKNLGHIEAWHTCPSAVVA